MTVCLYGIPNCDTVKKARVWLAGRGVAYRFHDYKKAGVEPERLARWIAVAGLDRVLNRAGTTFRKLPDDVRAGIDAHSAVAVMVGQPSCIRRPIVEHPGGLLVGFDPEKWGEVF